MARLPRADEKRADDKRLLIEQGFERLANIPVLVLVLARPDFQPAWLHYPNVTQMMLTPLAPEISAALVHIVAAEHLLQPRLVAEIVERTDGLPLFIEEVTKAIVENQALGLEDFIARAPGSSRSRPRNRAARVRDRSRILERPAAPDCRRGRPAK
ncbi:MAG: hypothetical protein ACR2GP_04000 [Burkholderiaceae bacterium]